MPGPQPEIAVRVLQNLQNRIIHQSVKGGEVVVSRSPPPFQPVRGANPQITRRVREQRPDRTARKQLARPIRLEPQQPGALISHPNPAGWVFA